MIHLEQLRYFTILPFPTIKSHGISIYYLLSLSLQGLSVGSDSNGSGVVGLLEIARLFSILYSNPHTRGKYNLLFGLTSGGPYNYNGTHKVTHSLSF